ncbi:conserved hypothetical protein [Desulfamplus magnetovallimortis]|uniref:Solute-binding protein family 3/N-terminal domain-containing protein n=2 Tax=Desulfamplus magnetovallimortis TaxID=1246637 RepID=A0A1W1HFZ6_9BACT|nr:conserved hypothetical protein [Desulfamplus magnetovallimortis]
MSSYKKIFIAILILALCKCDAFSTEKLLVVTEEWAPYVYVENQEVKGFDYEVMVAVFSSMGYAVDFKLYPWKRCIHMIEKQQADAILDISRNAERDKIIFFPDENLSDSASVFFYAKGKSYSFEKLEDLKGLKIGTMLGYNYNQEFTDADYFTKEDVTTMEQNFKKLIHGRVDLVISNRNVGLFEAKKMGVLDQIAYLAKEVSGGANYLGFSKNEKNEKLAKSFSDQLQKFKKTDVYKEILQKYGQ